MANLAEDESAGLSQKHYPRCGEKWLHPDSGHVVEIEYLDFIGGYYPKGSTMYSLPTILHVKSDIPKESQCVIFSGDGKRFIRTVENFLERFERVG
jgi:hypothetical protein